MRFLFKKKKINNYLPIKCWYANLHEFAEIDQL